MIGAQRLPGLSDPSFRGLIQPQAASSAHPSQPVPRGWGRRIQSLPDGLFGGLARLCRVVGQDTRLPVLPGACTGPGPFALRSGLHRVGPARRIGVAARRQLRISGLGRPWAARLLHPGDAKQAQSEAQRDTHGHGPRGPQYRQQQRCPHGARTAGPRPWSSPRAARGGFEGAGPGRGRIRRSRAKRAGPLPPLRAGPAAGAESPAPRSCAPPAAARYRVGSRRWAREPPPKPPLSDVSLEGPRLRGGVSGSSYRRGRRRGRLKGKDPRKCPLLSEGEADVGGGVPYLPPRRGWCVPCDVRSSPPLPGWCALSDVRSRGRSCPSAPKAAGGLRAWGRGSGAARAPAPASFPSPGPA